jgi:hypothetical protein
MSEEEKEQERVNNQQQKRIKQLAMRDEENVGRINRNHHLEDINNDITFKLVNELGIEEQIWSCQSSINQTLLCEDEKGYIEGFCAHKALVCVTCDRCIIGIQACHWIPAKTLKFHEKILSASYHYINGINVSLKLQYTVEDELIHHLLLSPRARNKIIDSTYMCCEDCFSILLEHKLRKKPPKFAISNGFAIGHLPETIAREITPLVNNLVAPVRAFNYFVSFHGGREQKITGNFTFFAQDVSQNLGTLQHISSSGNNPCVFIVLLGSFTSSQLEKIKSHGSYNVETFKKVYKFLHENNEHYSTLPSVDNVPIPLIQPVHINNDGEVQEEGNNSTVENELCWKYWFPSVDDPNSISGSYHNCSEFAKALFVGEVPTLFFHPSKTISHANLSQLCPLAFP